MFAYVDETGNTGENLFDRAQPDFVTAALITRADFDVVHGAHLKRIAAGIGATSLHANQLGVQRIEDIADEVRKLLRSADARFAFSRIEKRYLLVTKIVDYVFDCGENLAVPWHAYSLRYMRLLLVFKTVALVDQPLADLFWSALMAKRQDEGLKRFVEACRILRGRLSNLPDARSREIFGDALDWAIANPDELTIHSNDKVARYTHLPNVVGFINLLDGIEDWSERLGRPVKRIKHDRQSQFEQNFQFVHDMLTHASGEVLEWPGEEPRILRKVFGSDLIISSSEASAGIQVADLLLWLFKRVRTKDLIGPKSISLFNFMVGRGRLHDFSFENANAGLRALDQKISQVDQIDEETRVKAKQMIQAQEARRQKNIAEFDARKASSRVVENSRL